MKAICYKNTITKLPNWNLNDEVHLKLNLGFAYEINDQFIHFYGWDKGFKGISLDFTVTEHKNINNKRTLEDWVKENFGATEIKDCLNNVGNTIKNVWRPGLYYNSDIYQGIDVSDRERFLSEQAIRVLVQKLDEIFLYIEPDSNTIKTFSHKIRELLILSCTEVENLLNSFLIQSNQSPKRNGFSTNDYVKLKEKLYLDTFEFKLISYPKLGTFNPFKNWNSSSPTKSLAWYDAYNKTKHDRTNNFSYANLENTIYSIIACLILHCVKFGPYSMFQNDNHFSSIVKQHFLGQLSKDCKETFYIPKIEFPPNFSKEITVLNPKNKGFMNDFLVNDLIL